MISSPILRAEELDAIPKPSHEIQIYLNQKAPFSGLLIDVDQYRYYKTMELSSEMFERKMNDAGPKFSDYVWVAAGFFVFGLAAGSLAK